MENTEKHRFPKKAFLSRARTSSTSISSCSPSSSCDMINNGCSNSSRTFSGLDLLADSSELLAIKHMKDDSSSNVTSLSDDVKGSFSKRTRDDSLSYASLPDEMKVSFSELEETGISLDDLNFNTCPTSVEDAAPSNVTLDLTPCSDSTTKEESSFLPCSSGCSTTSSSYDYKTVICSTSNIQTFSSFSGQSRTTSGSLNFSSSSMLSSLIQSVTGNHSKTVSSGRMLGNSSDSIKTEVTWSHSASSDIGALIKASSNALAEEAGYQSWDAVTELPWEDEKLVEEISQVSTVGSSTGDVPKKKRRTSSLSKNKKMDNILCQVCGDLAAGFYCGAYICEACKKFYMRAYKQEKLKYVCLRDKKCVITKESRVQCQYCRYQKCLSLNMYCPKQGSESDSSKETHMSDIPCRVCSAPSSGFHFGAITCEGCKGFFRRMAKEREPQRYQCTKDGSCEINMMTRNLCKACRYKACLQVGMSVEGSRIGRQPNSVKHEISLELKQGVKRGLINKETHHGGTAVIKEELCKGSGNNEQMIINDVLINKEKQTSSGIKVKEEPEEFQEGCSLSKIEKSLSMDVWGNGERPSIEEHSVSISDILSQSVVPQVDAKEKSGNLFINMLLDDVSSDSILQVTEDLKNSTTNSVSPEVPLSSTLSEKVPCTTTQSQKSVPLKPELNSAPKKNTTDKNISKRGSQNVVAVDKIISESDSEETPHASSRDITPKSSSSKGSTLVVSSIIPQPNPYETDTDTSTSVSDDEQSATHREMMTLINDIIEAGRCLELINYRVFDTDLFSECKWVVEDVKEKFRNRYMDPKTTAKFDVDLSVYDNPETAWTQLMNDFNQHAYNTIKFAKNVPGFRALPIKDQSILLQASIYPIVLLHLSKVYDPATKTHNYFNLTKEEEAKVLSLFPMLRVLIQHFKHVGEIVTTLKLRNEEYALLAAILLLPAEVKGLKERATVEILQNRMSCALEYYEENTFQDGAVRYGSLLVRVAELVQCMLQHRLAIGLLLTAHPELKNVKTGQLFEELVMMFDV